MAAAQVVLQVVGTSWMVWEHLEAMRHGMRLPFDA